MAGSFKQFAIEPHYEILTLCGLANRCYIASTDPKLNSLVALPNELVCHVLGYWEPTLPRLLDLNPNFYDSESDGESIHKRHPDHGSRLTPSTRRLHEDKN